MPQASFLNLFSVIAIAAAVCGFGISAFIYVSKNRDKPFICPFGASCDPVVRSRFSRFFKIRNELLGMVYYGFIALGYVYLALEGALAGVGLTVKMLLAAVSLAAALFSTCLVFIQAFVLRAWCSWCLFSAALSIVIAVAAVLSF